MLTSLRIHNFRSLRELSVEGLTRVSLLVGGNNTGKTSVLEAAELVLGGHSPAVIARAPVRRGEVSVRIEDGRVTSFLEVAHLFFGHDIRHRPVFRIEALAPELSFFEGRIEPAQPRGKLTFYSTSVSDGIANYAKAAQAIDPGAPLAITVESDQFMPENLPFSEHGLRPETIGQARKIPGSKSTSPSKVQFIETSVPDMAKIRDLWDGVVLTPEEDRVTEVLRIIEPGIERVAALAGSHGKAEASIFVRLRDSDQRIPLGSMGEGIKRLMTLSLNLVNASGGYLLVDEIDTGLHHSVMVKMWRLVTEAATRLNVQVLATTHSLDCVRALASLYEEQQDLRDVISVHRIERNAEHNVPYSADELLTAARHHMEIR